MFVGDILGGAGPEQACVIRRARVRGGTTTSKVSVHSSLALTLALSSSLTVTHPSLPSL